MTGPQDTSDSIYVKNIGRNMAVAVVLTYAITVGLCYAGLGDLGQAAAIAGIPTIFAGPYLGLLITLTGAVRPRPLEARTDLASASPGAAPSAKAA